MLVKAAVNIEAEYNAHSPWNCSPTTTGIFDIRSDGLVMTSSIRKFLLSKISAFSVSKSPRCLLAIQDHIALPIHNTNRNDRMIVSTMMRLLRFFALIPLRKAITLSNSSLLLRFTLYREFSAQKFLNTESSA